MRLPNGPLRTVGEHEVDFHLHTDVNVTLVVTVDGGDIVQHIDVAEAEDEDEDETGETEDVD